MSFIHAQPWFKYIWGEAVLQGELKDGSLVITMIVGPHSRLVKMDAESVHKFMHWLDQSYPHLGPKAEKEGRTNVRQFPRLVPISEPTPNPDGDPPTTPGQLE